MCLSCQGVHVTLSHPTTSRLTERPVQYMTRLLSSGAPGEWHHAGAARFRARSQRSEHEVHELLALGSSAPAATRSGTSLRDGTCGVSTCSLCRRQLGFVGRCRYRPVGPPTTLPSSKIVCPRRNVVTTVDPISNPRKGVYCWVDSESAGSTT